ncbi:MAG: hypothetical protein AAF633_08150 [Chloroflexota bacterium]
MATTESQLANDIVAYCVQFFRKQDDRDAVLMMVVNYWPDQDLIEWDGNARLFTTRLVALLPKAVMLDVLKELANFRPNDPARDLLIHRLEAVDPETWRPANRPGMAERLEQMPPEPGDSPYMGLKKFDEENHALFFGRDSESASIVQQLHEHGFLFVIGASGSGKSSVVRAGVLPVMRGSKTLPDGTEPPLGDWKIFTFNPTAKPLTKLAVTLLSRKAKPFLRKLKESDRALLDAVPSVVDLEEGEAFFLLVDQFEELFTLCKDETERKQFIDNLVVAAQDPDENVNIVVTMRADFYGYCLAYPALRELLRTAQVPIGPLDRNGLIDVIVKPAQKGNWHIQKGLAEAILDDIGNQPGGLPLLSHALLETWRHRRGRTLTISGYQEAGEVKGAIARTAQLTYESLDPSQQKIVEQLFMLLTELGEGVEDTRRISSRDELVDVTGRPAEALDPIVQMLADARLIITKADGVLEVAHEALIRNWPLLRSWLNDNREQLRFERQMRADAAEWERLGEDAGALYRGARLERALEWEAERKGAQGIRLTRFLAASEAARQNLLEQERKRAEEAVQQAQRSQIQLVMASANTVIPLNQNPDQEAFNALMLMNAQGILFGTREKTPVSQAYLYDMARRSLARIPTYQENFFSYWDTMDTMIARYSKSGLFVGFGFDEAPTVFFYLGYESGISRPQILEPTTESGEDGSIGAVEVGFSEDDAWFIVVEEYGGIKLKNLNNLLDPLVVVDDDFQDELNPLTATAISEDGSFVVTCSYEQGIRLWPLAEIVSCGSPFILQPHESIFFRLFFSPDNRLLFGVEEEKIYIWDLAKLPETAPILVIDAESKSIRYLTYKPEDQILVAVIDDCEIWSWTIALSEPAATRGSNSFAIAQFVDHSYFDALRQERASAFDEDWYSREYFGISAFSPDQKIFAYVSRDVSTARLLRLRVAGSDLYKKVDPHTNYHLSDTLSGHRGEITSLAFSPDSRLLVTGSSDETIRLWDLESPDPAANPTVLRAHDGQYVNYLLFAPDSSQFIASGTNLRRWSINQSHMDASTKLLTERRYGLTSLMALPDGKLLSTADGNGETKLRIWDPFDGKDKPLFSTALGFPAAETVRLRPQGDVIAAASSSGQLPVWFWDGQMADDPLLPDHQLAFEVSGDNSKTLQFDPSGRLLLIASGHAVLVWEVDAIKAGQVEPIAEVDIDQRVNCLAITADGSTLCYGTDWAIYTLNLDTIQTGGAIESDQVVSIHGNHDAGPFVHLSLSSDQALLATTSHGGDIYLWDLREDQKIAVGSDDEESMQGTRYTRIDAHRESITGLQLAADGKMLYSISSDRNLLLLPLLGWLKVGDPIILKGHTSEIKHMTPLTDEHFIATACDDDEIRVWPTLKGMVAIAQKHATRNFTWAEWQEYLSAFPYEQTVPELPVGRNVPMENGQ